MQHWMLENDKYYIVGQDIDVIIILIIIIVWTASMKTLTVIVMSRYCLLWVNKIGHYLPRGDVCHGLVVTGMYCLGMSDMSGRARRGRRLPGVLILASRQLASACGRGQWPSRLSANVFGRVC